MSNFYAIDSRKVTHRDRLLYLLAGGLLAGCLVSAAEENDWETLPNGVLGQHADFQGADGVKIAGYVRKPAGPGPFPIVILLHGAGPTARPVTGQSPDRAEKIAAEAKRAGNQMGHSTHAPIPDFLAPLTDIAKTQCPILLISGRDDPNAPIALMELFAEKLHALGKEAEAYHPDNGPHGFYFGLPRVIPETAESTRRAVAFIKQHFEAARE